MAIVVLMLSAAWPVGYADDPLLGEADPTETGTGEPESDVSLPDLVGTVSANKTTRAQNDLHIAVVVQNGGGPASNNTTLAIHDQGERQGWSLLSTQPIPRLDPGEDYRINIIVPARHARMELRVTADWHDDLEESNETNNQDVVLVDAEVWKPRGGSGVSVDGMPQERLDVEQSRTSLRIRPVAGVFPSGSTVVIERTVLADVFTAPALLDGEFKSARKGPVDVVRVAIDSLDDPTRIEWVEFDPSLGTPMFTHGSPDNILLDDRPMWIRTAAMPSHGATGLAFANATRNNTTILELELEDGDHRGQGLRLNASWLRALGVVTPAAFYPDGTPIDVIVHQDEWVLDPPHFSTLFIGGLSGFQLVNDQPESTITYESGKRNDYDGESLGYWTTYRRIQGSSAAQVDESLVLPFVPHERYRVGVYVASPLSTVVPGHADVPFYPLALGNQHERNHPDPTDTEAIRGSMGFVIGNDANSQPQVRAYSWNLDDPAPTYHMTVPWNDWYWLEMEVRDSDTRFTVYVSTYSDYTYSALQTRYVSNTDLPLAEIDALVVATEGQGTPCTASGEDCTNTARIGVIEIDMLEPNHLWERFSSSIRWILSGDASCCSDDLTLNQAVVGSAGRAVLNEPITRERFSAEFVFDYTTKTADTGNGFTFFFYKDTSYTPAAGNHFGFADADTATVTGHRGYGLLFEPTTAKGNVWDGHVSLIKDTASNVLATTYTSNYQADGEQYVRVVVEPDWIVVSVNGGVSLSVPFSPDRTFGGMGFSGSVAGADLQMIRLLRLSTLDSVPPPAPASPYIPRAPDPHADAVGVPLDSVLLSWAGGDPNGDAVDYEVAFAPSGQPGDTACSLADIQSLTPSCEVTGLVEGQEYCASVSAGGQPVELSWCFRADRAPGAAHSPFPNAGAMDQSYTVDLNWTTPGDPDGQEVTHTVLLDSVNPPVSPACDPLQTGTTCLVGDLVPDTTYYWLVTSTDGILETIAPLWTFTTGPNVPPMTPSAPIPSDGQERVDVATTLAWMGGDANIENPTYTVKLGTSSPPTSVVCTEDASPLDIEPVDSGSCTIPTLEGGTTYYWQVVASDGRVETEGPIWKFKTNSPPGPASDPRPNNGQENLPLNVEFNWRSGGDPDGDPLSHAVYLRKYGSSSPWIAVCTTTGATPCKAGLESATTFLWYVSTTDGISWTTSPLWYFTTCYGDQTVGWSDGQWSEYVVSHGTGTHCNLAGGSYRYSPFAPTPSNGAAGQDPYVPALTWAHGAEMLYTVFFDTSPSPTTILCMNIQEARCPLPALDFEQTYYWRVEASGLERSWDGGGSINYHRDVRVGPEWSFTTAPYVINPFPADASVAIDPYRLNVSWMTLRQESVAFTVHLDVTSPPGQALCERAADTACESFYLLRFDTQYFWRVTAHFPGGDVVGPLWSFRTDACSGLWCPEPYEIATLDYYGDASREACTEDPEACEMADEPIPGTPIDAWADPMDPAGFEGLLTPQRGVEEGEGEPGCPEPETNRACTVIVLHGWAGDGEETASFGGWVQLVDFFDQAGYDVFKLDYYGGACERTTWPNRLDDTAVAHGQHHKGFANEHPLDADGCDGDASHNTDTDYRHLAYHVAWFIYDEYSAHGKPVDVVAHSMGGLMIRYALGAVQLGREDWPPFLLVENVVTIASPHGGTKWACAAYWGSWVNWKGYQAAQFCRASAVAKDMMANMRHPQGNTDEGSTYWMTMGSAFDGAVVPTSRSVEMDADFKIIHFNEKIDFGNSQGREQCEGDPQYGHSGPSALYRDAEDLPGDRCIAWMAKGHASYNEDWQAWPWWDKAMRPVPDMYKHSVI